MLFVSMNDYLDEYSVFIFLNLIYLKIYDDDLQYYEWTGRWMDGWMDGLDKWSSLGRCILCFRSWELLEVQ